MRLEFARDHTIPASYALLPAKMRAPAATAMLLTIGLQESAWQYRRQIGGPAHSYWQFELIGVRGVLQHYATAEHAASACEALDYQPDEQIVYEALSDNDVLACAFARLLLWQFPGRLPARDDPDEGWRQYLAQWRPGRPHPDTWADHYARVWALIDEA